MQKKRHEKKLVTRQKILDAAYELFARQGYDETSYTDIAKLAGLGYGTIYIHFDSKESLLFEHYLELIYKQADILRSIKQEGRNALEQGLYLMNEVWTANLSYPTRKLTVFFSYRWVSSKKDYDRAVKALNTVLDVIGGYFVTAQKEGLISAAVDIPTCLSLIRTAYLHALQDARFGEKERNEAKLKLNQQIDYLLQLKTS